MNDSDTEFVDKTAIENLEKDISEAVTYEKDGSNVRNFILRAKPVRIAKPDSESIDDSDVLSGKSGSKKDAAWKWNTRFEKPGLKKCSLPEASLVNINVENPSLFHIYPETDYLR